MNEGIFIIAINHNPYTGNFFLDIKKEKEGDDQNLYVISLKIPEAQAFAIAKLLGLRVMVG